MSQNHFIIFYTVMKAMSISIIIIHYAYKKNTRDGLTQQAPGPRSATVSVERHVSWKRCAMGFEIRFLLFGGVSKMSAQSAATCIETTRY